MNRRKRSFREHLDEKPKLQIVLAANDTQQEQHAEPLAPHRHIVQLFSLCAAGLPAQPGEDAVWDLSNILIDGQAVSRATVVAWLNAAYQIVYRADFDRQEEEDNPTNTIEGLYQVLSFADAVDSTDGLVDQVMSQMYNCTLHAQLGEQQLVLEHYGVDYVWQQGPGGEETGNLQLNGFPPGKSEGKVVGQPAATAQQKRVFVEQVAAQTEQLLWLAYRLQLQPLVEQLHGFVRSQSLFDYSLLRKQADAIFTPRVLEAAATSGLDDCQQAVADSVLRQDVVFADGIDDKAVFLEPLALTEEQQQPLEFDAVLRNGLAGIARGTKVHVQLDLFGTSSMHINDDKHRVRLCMGPCHLNNFDEA